MTQTIELAVTGMKCGGCEANVKTKLEAVDGVLTVEASSQEKKVKVEYEDQKTGLDAIKQAIVEAGFSVES